MTAPAVLYVRVSSAEQVAGTSLATQERDCRAACARLGLEVRAVFRDEGKSAKSTVGRDGLAAAMNECKRTGAALVVYKFDRLARNARDALTVRDTLVGRGARIVSATEGEASETPLSRMVFGVASLVAEFDNSQRAERSRRGMVDRVTNGGWCHRAPIGFKLVRREDGLPILAPDEAHAPAIRAAFDGLANGTLRELDAVRLVMRGADCTRGTAYSILRGPIYKGVLPASKLTDGKERAAAFPGLVSAETWEAAQGGLSTVQVGIERMNANPKTPFTGVLFCAECGHRLVGGFSRGRHGARFGYYRCPACGVSVSFADAEAQVRDALAGLADCRDFLRLVRANFELIDADARKEDDRAAIAAARRVIAREESRLTRARGALVDGLFTPDEFEGFRRECEAKIREARGEIVAREKWAERRLEFFDALLSIAAKPDALLELPAVALRDALRAVCGRVTVTREKRLVFPPESTVEILRTIASRGSTSVSDAPLILRLLKRDGCGLFRAAAALRAG